MRWFFRLREHLSSVWLGIKLSLLLGQFLLWFGINRYLLERVFLISTFWLALALLLVVNQVLVAQLPNTFTPDLNNLAGSTRLQEKVSWKLVSLSQLEETCAALATSSKLYPTHQSLLRNVALCWLAKQHNTAAQQAWNQAQARNPNQD